jgi:hypothetical protein
MKIEQPIVLLKCNHYIKCFCFMQNVAKILTAFLILVILILVKLRPFPSKDSK